MIVSGLAIFFIVRQVDPLAFARQWTAARYGYVMPCVALLLAGLVTRALRWRVLLGGGLPLARAFSIMNVAYLVNGILPLRIGEIARMYLAWRAEPPVPVLRTASTVIAERLLDLLAVVIMIALALSAASVPPQLQTAGIAAGVLAVGGFGTLILLARYRTLSRRMAARAAGKSLFERLDLMRWTEQFLDGLFPLTQPRAISLAICWTALSWGASVLAGYVLMYTFYDQASWAATALYIAAAALAIAVPAMPASVGPYESSIILALGATGYGQPFDTALAFAVMVHGVNVVVHAVTGIVGLVQEGITLEQLSHGVRKVHEMGS